MDHFETETYLARTAPSIIGEMAAFVEEVEAGGHEPPKKVDAGKWGEVDEYEAGRFKVWINDNARK